MDSPHHEEPPHTLLDRYLSGDRGRAAALARRCEVTEATVSGWRRAYIRPSGVDRRAAIEEMTGIPASAWETARASVAHTSNDFAPSEPVVVRDAEFDQTRDSVTGAGV